MDPFSIVTGAGGLVSLGITVCNGLISYCGSYRSREDDITSLQGNAERLRKHLEVLDRQHLGVGLPPMSPSLKISMDECVEACKTCLDGLSRLSDKYSPPMTGSLQRSRTSLTRKISFPLQKDKFESFRKQINQLHVTLSFQVGLLNYDAMRNLRQETLSESLNLSSIISAQGQDIQEQIAAMVPDLSQTLESGLAKSEQSLQARMDSLETMIKDSLRIEEAFPDCAQSIKDSSTASTLPQASTNESELMTKIAIEYSQYAFLRSLHIQHNFTIRATVPQGSPAFDLIDGITFNMGSYSTVQSLQRTLQSCLRGLQRLFMEGRAWPTDIEDSTGNNLLHVATSAFWHFMADEMKEIYSQFLQTLVEFGVPLKDTSCLNETPIAIVLQRLASREKNDFSGFTVATGLVKSLLDLGVDVLDIMPLRTFGPSILPIVGHGMFEEQGTMDQGELSRALLEKWDTQVCDILARSDAERYLLARGKVGETPLHIATCWPRGMELLLQLGGDTITGIINAEDDDGSTALDYALKLVEPECVSMLLDSSAEMDLEVIQNIAKWETTPGRLTVVPVLTQALAARRKKLLSLANDTLHGSMILDNLSLNKEDLIQEDAFEVIKALDEKEISVPKEFRSVQPGSVYHCAYMNNETAESLFRAGFSHTNVELIGLTPLMIIDFVGLSYRNDMKLMCSSSALGLVEWFLSHGEDLSRPIPVNAITRKTASKGNIFRRVSLVHRIASEMGRSLRYAAAFGSERYTAISQQILTSSVLDPCECLCTQSGCSAASVFSREVWKVFSGATPAEKLSELDRTTWRITMDLLTSRLSDHSGARQFASSFIRVSTFERLGMSHTCCRYVENSGMYEGPNDGVALAILRGEYIVVEMMDPEDGAEIQDEERYLAERLEELVHEFDVKYEELGLSLGDFFWSYWWIRMNEVEAEDKVSREELVALRKTGVILEDA
ncbi:hypothetical protein J7T55_000056 [Diaporthe amygdali]|uniref:uncharacterized protein n=1 Tax=Phomopsis amygdali TaxID=1214568 RepID=UPI0022FEA0A4|nr:uncharacterized protein J7T55_000056 [Diaporthe amygdali]KAJ0107794.1 hypothetical protein J7T55_000056 [Diaporthe amygdali]